MFYTSLCNSITLTLFILHIYFLAIPYVSPNQCDPLAPSELCSSFGGKNLPKELPLICRIL